jgi:hypothetical protein
MSFNNYRVATERVAYKYIHDTYVRAGRFSKAFQVMKVAFNNPQRVFWGGYPVEFSLPFYLLNN